MIDLQKEQYDYRAKPLPAPLVYLKLWLRTLALVALYFIFCELL